MRLDRHFVSGQFIEPATGEPIPVFNPATEALIAHVSGASRDEAIAAVDAAAAAQKRGRKHSIYRLWGACAMGPDSETSVVDERLCVHGMSGLRIVEASIFPNITSRNINAPTMMVAEKGADMILEDAQAATGAQGRQSAKAFAATH